MALKVFPSQQIESNINVPGDKSISHRSVIIGSLSAGKVLVKNFLDAEDCNRTLDAFRKLGVDITYNNTNDLVISGVGIRGLKQPSADLFLGNSGTSMRIILGVLAGQNFTVTLTGDDSLRSRPMDRVISPLSQMGAILKAKNDNYAPITIKGGELNSITYNSLVSSAQVKSAILLAGLYADKTTSVIEPYKSRDHTERILSYLGTDVEVEGNKVKVNPVKKLEAKPINIPGDISSAMYFIVAGLIMSDSKILIQNVGLNPTRIGAINILKKMGGRIKIKDKSSNKSVEPVGDIEVRTSNLQAVEIGEEILPSAIDEIPLIIVAACFAKGITKIYKAFELRVKETDRIKSMVSNLVKMGANIEVEKDDIFINGGALLKGAELESYKDHRTAMSLIIAGIACKRQATVIDDIDCINTSFPGFFDILKQIGCRYELVK